MIVDTSNYDTRSATPSTPIFDAQWTQQYIEAPASMPCPRIRQPQCAQIGAMACAAHSRLSKV